VVAFNGDGPWELPIGGWSVKRISFSYLPELWLRSGRLTLRIMLEGRFELREAAGSVVRMDAAAERRDDLVPLSTLAREVLAVASFDRDSALSVAFRSGRALVVPVDDRGYEAWEARCEDASNGYLVVGAPGRVAIWDERSESGLSTDPDAQERLAEFLGRSRGTPREGVSSGGT
jgi:hypothetical protein